MKYAIQTMSTPTRMPQPPTRTEGDDQALSESNFISSLVAHSVAAFDARIGQVLVDESFIQWLEETDKDKSEFIRKCHEAYFEAQKGSVAVGAKKAGATSNIPIEDIKRTLNKFDDGYVEGGCIMSFSYRPPEGRYPYELCGAKTREGVCANCKKKKAGSELHKAFAKRGYDVKGYRKKNREDGHRWATNKLKNMGASKEGANQRLKTLQPDSDDSSDQEEKPELKWVTYEHDDSLDYNEQYKVVACIEGEDRIVVGIDYKNDNKMVVLTEREAKKFESLGMTISAEAIEAKPEKKTSTRRPNRKTDADS